MSFLIHVGYCKTGTTWLQNSVFPNNELGFCCPWGNQAGIAVDEFVTCNPFRFDSSAAYAPFEPATLDANRRSLVAVLSNEALCGDPIVAARYDSIVADRLRETFPKAKILITIREQSSAIVSLYREHISYGGVHSIDEFLGLRALPPGFSPPCKLDYFEYHLLVGYYQHKFGDENVLVLPQELLKEDSQAYCDRLATFMGIDQFPVPQAESARVGLRGASLAYLRACNQVRFGVPDWSKAKQSPITRLVRRVAYLLDSRVPDLFNRRLEAGLQSTVEDFVGDYFASSNSILEGLAHVDLATYGYQVTSPAWRDTVDRDSDRSRFA